MSSRRKNYTLNASEATRTRYLSARSNKYTNRGINSIPHFVPFTITGSIQFPRLRPIHVEKLDSWLYTISNRSSKKKKSITKQKERDNLLSSRPMRGNPSYLSTRQGLMLIRAIERYPVWYPFQFKLKGDAINSLENCAFNLFATSIKLSF